MNEAIAFVGLRAQLERLRPEIEAAFGRVLDHGQFIQGPEVFALENALQEHCGARHAVALSSGTDALLLALLAHGVGPGDAVLVPAFTFTATAEVVLLVGAEPVFVDVDGRTFDLDLADLEARLREVRRAGRLRPRAVLAVDLFGLPADYERLAPLCERESLLLIDDAAQSFGGALHGARVGTLAPVTTTSFFPAKPLGGYGDGGALFCDDAGFAAVVRSLREHGQGAQRYEVLRVGINGRLDSLQAAVLLVKLGVFAEELERREALARRYDERLRHLVTVPQRRAGATSAWAQYTILVEERDRVRSALEERGVPTAIYYPKPMHLQPAYAAYGAGPGSMPVSERLCGEVLSLPMNPYLQAAQIERVCDAVEEVASRVVGR
jgi:dTDP-4-amino-4,6-dideoxygalactose transaminase